MRPGVLIGPAVLRGPRTVHLVKHPVSGAAFEVGPKERFVMGLLDGTRDADDVVAAYAERFRLRLPETQWTRLLGLLGARGLLAGAPDPAP
ncbi:peptidase M50, partial [Streptomyces sp. SID2131]|nr:peptidase M50 [Streptomyces sp. SID2131]